jgi:hypothetical protein
MACPDGEALFCANFTSLCRPGWLFVELPGRGLEPLRISPPDPKSGASANFATLAKNSGVIVARPEGIEKELRTAMSKCAFAVRMFDRLQRFIINSDRAVQEAIVLC